MKKRRLNILWIMAALFAFTGCNDFLDIQPVGKVMPKTAKEYPLGIRAPGKMAETRRHQECFRIFGRT